MKVQKQNEDYSEFFENEIEIMTTIARENPDSLTAAIDVFKTPTNFFIVMELASGALIDHIGYYIGNIFFSFNFLFFN